MVSFDIYLLYASVGIVCGAILSIILNRVTSTVHKETIDEPFCTIIRFFLVFCVVDFIWGLLGSPYLLTDRSNPAVRVAYDISSYGFHTMSALSAFMCSYYGSTYLKLRDRVSAFMRWYRCILLVLTLIYTYQNIITHISFTIDEQAVYHSTPLRYLMFFIQFCQYIPLLVYSLVKTLRLPKKENHYQYNSLIIFFLIALIFGFLQMLFPDGAFYSLGFTVVSVTIFSYNVTSQRELFIAEKNAADEREKSRKQIEEALEVAKAANNAKTVFLSNMSHDIRTPINAIMGMVMIAREQENPPKTEDCLRKINSTSHHLLSLINDVLDVSRIESGKTVIGKESLDVRSVMDMCRSITRGQMEGRDVRLTVNYDDIQHPYLMGDPLHIRQVLINILGNAVKFTPDGGEITFTGHEVSFHNDLAEIAFIIKDTGIGMSPEFLPHLFEAFAQENGGSRTNYKGTGLGMSITKQLTELMGGTIAVESEPGKGSTFTVILPMPLDKEHRTVKEEDMDVTMDMEGLKVLLVEDNDLNMEIATFLLEDRKMVVTPAENGLKALEAFRDNPAGTFDVILMDIMMPEMNGLDATRAIRALDRPDAKSIPIIAMTANAFDEDRKRALEAGMDAHIAKPLDVLRMFTTIGTVIRKKQGIS